MWAGGRLKACRRYEVIVAFCHLKESILESNVCFVLFFLSPPTSTLPLLVAVGYLLSGVSIGRWLLHQDLKRKWDVGKQVLRVSY